MSRSLPLLLAASVCFGAEPVVIEGDVPSDGLFFTVPVEVSAGTAALWGATSRCTRSVDGHHLHA